MTVRNAETNFAPFGTANFNNLDLTTHPDGEGLQFGGQLTGVQISNQEEWHSQIRGEFGGNQAAEAGGTWSVKSSILDTEANGVFRATKQ